MKRMNNIGIGLLVAVALTACQARTITVEKPVEVTRIVEVTSAAPAAAAAAAPAAESDEVVVGVALPLSNLHAHIIGIDLARAILQLPVQEEIGARNDQAARPGVRPGAGIVERIGAAGDVAA